MDGVFFILLPTDMQLFKYCTWEVYYFSSSRLYTVSFPRIDSPLSYPTDPMVIKNQLCIVPVIAHM